MSSIGQGWDRNEQVCHTRPYLSYTHTCSWLSNTAHTWSHTCPIHVQYCCPVPGNICLLLLIFVQHQTNTVPLVIPVTYLLIFVPYCTYQSLNWSYLLIPCPYLVIPAHTCPIPCYACTCCKPGHNCPILSHTLSYLSNNAHSFIPYLYAGHTISAPYLLILVQYLVIPVPYLVIPLIYFVTTLPAHTCPLCMTGYGTCLSSMTGKRKV